MLRRELAAIIVGQAIGDGIIGWVLLQSSLDQSAFSWSLSDVAQWFTALQASPMFYPSIALIVLSAFGAVQSVAAWRYDGTGLPAWLRPLQRSRFAFGVVLSILGLVGFSILGSCLTPGCGVALIPFWPLVVAGFFVLATGLICLLSARRVARNARPVGADLIS